MNKGSYSLVLALLAGITCANGFAQKLEVGAYGGASLWSRPSFSIPSSEPPGRTDIDYRFADGGLFGLRVREHLTQHIGLEQSWMITGTNNIERGLSVAAGLTGAVELPAPKAVGGGARKRECIDTEHLRPPDR